MTAPERHIMAAIHSPGFDMRYDVPVRYRSRWSMGMGYSGYATARHAEPVSLVVCFKSVSTVASDAAQRRITMPTGAMRLQYGSLATALLLLLRAHWLQWPKKRVLIICESNPAVLAVGQYLKEQRIPARTIAQRNLRYTEAEYAELKALGRNRTLAILVDNNYLTIGLNRFRGIRHVFILSRSNQPDYHSNHAWQNQFFRPVSAARAPTIHVTIVHPAHDETDDTIPSIDMAVDRLMMDI
jgi:hypothetical protein